MIHGTATLVVDLGNSATRVETHFGKTEEGFNRYRLSILDNRYGEIPKDKLSVYVESDVYSKDNSRIFDRQGTYYCNGDICNKEFSATALRPTALEKKYESLVTQLSLCNALAKGYEDISILTGASIEEIEVDWNMVLLLPPDDIDAGARKLAELAKSITEIDFTMPDIKKSIYVKGVKVFPEGFAALIGVIFVDKNTYREGYEYLVAEDSTTLVIDIGAGTTDFLLANGANVVSTSRFTREVGGNNVHQRVRRLLKDQGTVLSDSIVRRGCETGYVKIGGTSYSITSFIAKAKSDVSKQLVDAVQEFFEDNMIPVKSINNILVCGGGAEKSENESIAPIADYLISYMRALSENINLVELPTVLLGGREVKASPRLLNIIGAGILA